MFGSDLVLRLTTKGFALANTKLKALGQNSKLAGTKLGMLAKIGATAVVGALAGITKGAIESVQAFARFDAELTQSLAIMKTTEQQQRAMAIVAREVATETTISATESAEAYFFLASAGLDAEQSMKALPQVARFAQAGMFDMALATDLATDAQSALGLTVKDAQQNLTNLTRVTDVLVKANTLANASVQQFSESLTNKAGAQLKVVNKDIEEGVAVLAAFADAGVKGAAGGEKLNQIIRDIPRAAERNKAAFQALNLQMYDADGNMRNLADIIEELDRVFKPMSDSMKASTLDQLGLNRGVADAVKILSGTTDRIREYESALREAGGTTKTVAELQLETFNSQLKILQNQMENLKITIGQDLVPGLVSLTKELQIGLERFQNFRNRVGEVSKAVKLAGTVVAGFIAGALGPVGIAIAGVSAGLVGLYKWLKKSNDTYEEAQAKAQRLNDAYARQQAYMTPVVTTTRELANETLSLDQILDGTNYTVAELTGLFNENGIAMTEAATEALDLAKAYDKSLLGGLQSVISAMDKLEAIQDRIANAEKSRDRAVKDKLKADKNVEQATDTLAEARKRYAEVQGLGEQVTHAEELAILNQRTAIDELTEAQDGSRQMELELAIAKQRLTELIEESTAVSREEEQALKDITRAEEDLTRAEDLRTEAINKVKEAQDNLTKVTEKSTRNLLEQAIAQAELKEAMDMFGAGTKGFSDAIAKMSSITGEKLDFLIGKFQATFREAEKLKNFELGPTTPSSPASSVTYPSTGGLSQSRKQEIVSRMGEPNLTVNVTTGAILGSEQDVEEAVSKALVKAQKRGISIV